MIRKRSQRAHLCLEIKLRHGHSVLVCLYSRVPTNDKLKNCNDTIVFEVILLRVYESPGRWWAGVKGWNIWHIHFKQEIDVGLGT